MQTFTDKLSEEVDKAIAAAQRGVSERWRIDIGFDPHASIVIDRIYGTDGPGVIVCTNDVTGLALIEQTLTTAGHRVTRLGGSARGEKIHIAPAKP